MENQHRKIKGYRELSQDEIDLMNEIKQKGVELNALIAKLQNREAGIASADASEFDRANESMRWIDIGKAHLQQGLMALTRAVAKPGFF